MKSFAVIALVACFLGVLITTVASDEKTENQEDETKLPAPEEAFGEDIPSRCDVSVCFQGLALN